jgi:hypothetical protein
MLQNNIFALRSCLDDHSDDEAGQCCAQYKGTWNLPNGLNQATQVCQQIEQSCPGLGPTGNVRGCSNYCDALPIDNKSNWCFSENMFEECLEDGGGSRTAACCLRYPNDPEYSDDCEAAIGTCTTGSTDDFCVHY